MRERDRQKIRNSRIGSGDVIYEDQVVEKTHNGICTQKSTEDWLNKLSEEQDKLQERIKEGVKK